MSKQHPQDPATSATLPYACCPCGSTHFSEPPCSGDVEAFLTRLRCGRCGHPPSRPASRSPLRSRLAIIATTAFLTTLLALLLSSSALAITPWWHLTSGTRPAYIAPGAGKPGTNEVKELIVSGAPGEVFVLARITEEEIAKEEFFYESGPFIGEPRFVEVPVGATSAEIQASLEAPNLYGSGNVEVTGAPGGPYTIAFKGALAEQTVPFSTALSALLAFAGTIEAKVKTPGRAASPDGEIYLTAENIGDANVEGSKTKVSFKDVVPKGLEAVAVTGTKPYKEGAFNKRELLPCSLSEEAGTQIATCTLSQQLAPYDQLEMRVSVNVKEGASSGEQNEVSVSGGGAAPASLKRAVTISSAPVPFGVEDYEMDLEEEGGAPTTQAGAHPFQLSTTIALNQLADINQIGAEKPEVIPPALAKDLAFKLPPGLIGNPTPIAQCTTAQFFETVNGQENRCPPDSAVGVAVATVHEPGTVGTGTLTEPIFNLEPRVGEPARFGFYVVIANSPVFIDTAVRAGSDYGVTASVSNITQTAAFLSSEVTFWGTPGDSRHDGQRGWGCLYAAREATSVQPCTPAGEQHPKPFLSMPTSCGPRLSSSVRGDSWSEPGSFFQVTGSFMPEVPLNGCNRLQFSPEIKVAPDAQEASRPTGLTIDVHVPQEVNENSSGLASSNVKSITVALPEGVTVNPSAADGLLACSEAQTGFLGGATGEQGELLFTPDLPEAFCPDAAKIGTVKIVSPLLPPGQYVQGALYLATPAPNQEAGKNPFNTLLSAYIIAQDPLSGTLVKLPGSIALDPDSGRLTSTFDNNPQLAFEDAEIHLFGGERAPLGTPASCGLKTTEATFTPWSGGAPVKTSSSFMITSGPHNTPCPPTPGPFTPTLTGGSTNINAGSFTPLTTTINRSDGDQPIQAVKLSFPPGLSGILRGLTLCPEAQANAGSCPASSEIGHTIVSVGLGSDPFSVTGGQVFFTESYKGAPFGLSIVNPAVAGPFDLGKVIVRAKVEIDPHTAALTVTTDESGPYKIPHILDGIPLQIQHVNVLIDRKGFTFNPTNCNPQSITGTISSSEGASAPVQTPFQATNCANLKFAPDFKVSTAGKTSKAAGASLKVKLTYPSAPPGTYANVAKVKVSLPKQLPSRLTTLQKACTAAAFAKDPKSCPKESEVGKAKVITPLLPVPLEGPAYFVSHGGEAFPDLTIVLKGYGVTVDLIGSTQIKNGITTSTFKTTPDVPFSSFELELPQGKYSALAANANLCTQKLTMPTEFQAQNGLELHQQTKISVTGCKKKPLTNKQKLQKALKACHKKKDKAKRRACESQARKRYPVKGKAKKRR
jgi:hypothetical protein